MILESLVQYYEAQAALGKIAPLGYSRVKVSYGLSLGDDGALLDVVPLLEPVEMGKKMVERPRDMRVPEPVVRSMAPRANFLCDGSAYLLGYDEAGKPERTRACFLLAREMHENILAQVDTPFAKAILCFFETWDGTTAQEHPALAPYLPQIVKGANLVFMKGVSFAHEDPVICAAWDRYYRSRGEGEQGICLVKGERASIAKIHPKIKGVRDAQSAGAAIVSFNDRAYESYGHDKEQGLNAPVGEYAAFAYTTALNALLADPRHRVYLGDMTIVFWSADGNEAADEIFSLSMDPFAQDGNAEDTDALLTDIFQKLKRGDPLPRDIRADCPFFVLGLAPNAARVSIRFFLRDTFGKFLGRLADHYERMNIVRPSFDRVAYVRIPQMLQEMSNPNATTKRPPNILSGALVRDILSGSNYPPAMLAQVMIRIRAEQGNGKITRGRAAMVKAYLLKNGSNPRKEEECTVSLEVDSNNRAYVLGRLFSVLEAIQESGNPGINTTIKDRYFNAACATPASIFPTLLKLSNHHLRKVDTGLRIHYEKQLSDLLGRLEAQPLPARMNLEDQGMFVLGYYHQTQARYTKKQKEET